MVDKTDLIRLLDVIGIGPAMMIGSKFVPGMLGRFLWISGVATVVYNGYNLMESRRSIERKRSIEPNINPAGRYIL